MDSPLGVPCGKCGRGMQAFRQKGSLCRRCRGEHLALVPPPPAQLTFGALSAEDRGEDRTVEPFTGDDAA